MFCLVNNRILLLCVLVSGVIRPHALAAQERNQWGNWRGPNYNGTVENAKPPIEWSDKKNIYWKTPIPGRGSGSPIVWDNQVIVVTALETSRSGEPDRNGVPPGPGGSGASRFLRSRMNNPNPSKFYEFIVLSYDLETGKQLWKTVVNESVPHEGGHTTNTFASGSPVTDGEKIFVSFGSFGVYALDMEGKQLWGCDLGKMTTRNSFGEASSPALYGNTLIVPWDQDGYEDKNENGQRDDDELLSSLVAIDTETGRVKWRTPRPTEKTTWATPLIVDDGQRVQVVTNGTRVRSYSIEDGRLLWECGGQVTNPIPTPLRYKDDVICMTGYRGNAVFSMALGSTGKIDGTDSIRWSRNDTAPYVSSAALYRGQIYLTKSRDGITQVLNADSGEVVIPDTRLPGIRSMYASQVAAGGHVYYTGRSGNTSVIRHGSTFEPVAVNELGEPVDASPAIVGDAMILRGSRHLFCIRDES